MIKVLPLLLLAGACLARPQTDGLPASDAEFLGSLLGGDPAGPPAAPGGTQGCPDVGSLTDDAFLAALTGGCGDNVTALQPEPVTRCERGELFCTPYFRCAEADIVSDGLGEFDVRINKAQFEAEHGFITHSECPRFGDVCCANPQPETPRVTPEFTPQCGRRNPAGIGARILGFNESESQFGEFPWMAAVLRAELVGGEERNFFLCGGSLIHPQVVLTAAHCLNGLAADARLRVRLGEWDTQRESELFLHQDVAVERFVVHPDFSARRVTDDVALLFLAEPAQLQEHIDTLCLPDSGQVYSAADCIATGWGKDGFLTGQFQTVLKQIDLPLVPHAACQAALRKTRLGKYFRLDRSMTCAGGVGGRDTCTGDGGSPLACRDPLNPDRYIQLGVVAWGIGCGLDGVPGVYADVAQQVGWIQGHLASLPPPPPQPQPAGLAF